MTLDADGDWQSVVTTETGVVQPGNIDMTDCLTTHLCCVLCFTTRLSQSSRQTVCRLITTVSTTHHERSLSPSSISVSTAMQFDFNKAREQIHANLCAQPSAQQTVHDDTEVMDQCVNADMLC